MINEKALHIAIIPDGNRRWAKDQKLHPWKGHERAVENFNELAEWCKESPRVETLTIWCFSTENWKRDSKEIEKLMTMLEEFLRKERDKWVEEKSVRAIHSGRSDRIPESLSNLLEEVADQTKYNDGFTLHLALDYGGQDEVVRAAQKVDGEITEELIRDNLDHPELSDIDLIIRTSGEMRTSNFFLWQSTYSEWVFTEKKFPDFGLNDLKEAIDEYDQRTRRYGGS